MKISEIFVAHQGEIDVGKLTTFVRLSGCNLKCDFCDTQYHTDGVHESVYDLGRYLQEQATEDITITGGEPMLQKTEMFALMRCFPEFTYALETNGTIYDERMNRFDRISVSPKLQAVTYKAGCVCNNSYHQLAQLPNVRWKFVYEDKSNLWWEEFQKSVDIDNDKMWIMPEGKTREAQLSKLEEVANYCLQKGYNFAPRSHVLTYGDRRGV